MNRTARFTAGLIVAVAGAAGLALGGASEAAAAPQVCPGLPGQASSSTHCAVKSGPQGLSLAVVADGGQATVNANNFAGPAAIALGPNANVRMDGVRPGLAIAIAGPNATVVVDGKNGPVCSGPGMSFSGDFQTLKGCWR
ncbi:hypothetical protein HH308_11660 [Gordonia sp. TBRC 11910]|uniref:Protein kinase n=1 Tax=Gordonia asplenii TaxID=2725283 RepID=A0A848KV03_9ACTN|nr:hypothetical protein [Gordonia asplenii]NMO01867.1 hypothetical protein [Gordonia asplenii]